MILAFVAMGSLILAPILSVSLVWVQLPSAGNSVLGRVQACLSCALPHTIRNAASVNALVESFVSIRSPKLKQMSVRPYEEQPKSMMPV